MMSRELLDNLLPLLGVDVVVPRAQVPRGLLGDATFGYSRMCTSGSMVLA